MMMMKFKAGLDVVCLYVSREDSRIRVDVHKTASNGTVSTRLSWRNPCQGPSSFHCMFHKDVLLNCNIKCKLHVLHM